MYNTDKQIRLRHTYPVYFRQIRKGIHVDTIDFTGSKPFQMMCKIYQTERYHTIIFKVKVANDFRKVMFKQGLLGVVALTFTYFLYYFLREI